MRVHSRSPQEALQILHPMTARERKTLDMAAQHAQSMREQRAFARQQMSGYWSYGDALTSVNPNDPAGALPQPPSSPAPAKASILDGGSVSPWLLAGAGGLVLGYLWFSDKKSRRYSRKRR